MNAEKLNFCTPWRISANLEAIKKCDPSKLIHYRIENQRLYLLDVGIDSLPITIESKSDQERLLEICRIKESGGEVLLHVFEDGKNGQLEFFPFYENSVSNFSWFNEQTGKLDDTAIVGISERVKKNASTLRNEFVLIEPCGNGANIEYFFILGDISRTLSDAEEQRKITLVGSNNTADLCEIQKDIWELNNFRKRSQNISNQPVKICRGRLYFEEGRKLTSKLLEKEYEKLAASNQNQLLLRRWEKYSNLELDEKKERAQEYARFSIHYSSYACYRGQENKICFICEEITEVKWTGFEDVSKIGYAVVPKGCKKESEKLDSTNQMYITDAFSREPGSNILWADLDQIDASKIPDKGYIVPSVVGAENIANRRKSALVRVQQGSCPLPYLRSIVEQGMCSQSLSIRYNRMPVQLLNQKVFGGENYELTKEQDEAIFQAVNTPDVFLIQGPPGTGKTSIIKGILAYLEWIGKKQNRHFSVLIASESHAAVDRATNDLQYNGLFCVRLGNEFGKRVSETAYSKWITKIKEKAQQYINDNAEVVCFSEKTRSILSEVHHCRKALHNSPIAQNELRNAVDGLIVSIEENIPEHSSEWAESLNSACNDIINLDNNSNSEEWKQIIQSLLEKQKLTKEGFLADGKKAFSELYEFVEHNRSKILRQVEINQDSWDNLWDFNDFSGIDTVLEDITRLKNCVQGEKKSEDLVEKLFNKMEEQLNSIEEAIHLHYKNANGKKEDAVFRFLQHVDDDVSATSFMKEYASCCGVTCQQSGKRFLAYGQIQLESERQYDYVIIDEAAKANPLDLLIPLSKGIHIIMIGDHNQLPHLVDDRIVKMLGDYRNDESDDYEGFEESVSDSAEQESNSGNDSAAEKAVSSDEELLRESLFALIFSKIQPVSRKTLLSEQFRMNDEICKLISDEFYGSALISGPNVKEIAHHIERYCGKPLVWIDVPRENGLESKKNSGSRNSYIRMAEVNRVVQEAEEILKATDGAFSVGIISFYFEQVEELKRADLERKYPGRNIKIGTVDAFQGQEFDAVILSSVRSNDIRTGSKYGKNEKILTEDEAFRKSIGFLSAKQRQNVAFSRARKLLVMIGDHDTLLRFEEDSVSEKSTEEKLGSMSAFKALWERSWKFGGV